MNENFVTIATFTHEAEMLVLLAKLESEMIRCFTNNRTMVSIDPLISHAIGGIKLMVHKDDLDKAMEILKGFELDQSGKKRLDIIFNNKRYHKTSGFCPECDENTIYTVKKSIIEQSMDTLFFKKTRFLCLRCKHEWEK